MTFQRTNTPTTAAIGAVHVKLLRVPAGNGQAQYSARVLIEALDADGEPIAEKHWTGDLTPHLDDAPVSASQLKVLIDWIYSQAEIQLIETPYP